MHGLATSLANRACLDWAETGVSELALLGAWYRGCWLFQRIDDCNPRKECQTLAFSTRDQWCFFTYESKCPIILISKSLHELH